MQMAEADARAAAAAEEAAKEADARVAAAKEAAKEEADARVAAAKQEARVAAEAKTLQMQQLFVALALAMVAVLAALAAPWPKAQMGGDAWALLRAAGEGAQAAQALVAFAVGFFGCVKWLLLPALNGRRA